jgi:long-chain acyl-CoA synthetase
MTGLLFKALAEALAAHPESVIGNLANLTTGTQVLDESVGKRRQLAQSLPRERARVAVIRRNSPGYVSDLLAVLGEGHIPFLMDPSLGPVELARLFTDCGIDAVLHDESVRLAQTQETADCLGARLSLTTDPAEPAPELHPDTELCRLTSGSTRTPGCVEFSGSAVLAAAEGWRAASGFGPADRVLCFAGLYNGLGFNAALIPGILCGVSLYLPSGLPAASNIRRHMAEIDPTVLVAFPAAYDGLATSGRSTLDLYSLRLALSSAARLSTETSSVLTAHGIRIADYYGIAETGPLTFNPDPQPGGGQGFPLPGVSLRFDGDEPNSGRLLARSRSMGTRYLNYPGMLEERITESGHYRTNDQGSLTDRGELRLGDRLDDSLSIGGKKVSVAEVEELLTSHPDVTACAVAVVTPPDGGHPFLGAVLVGTQVPDVVAIRRYCMARAAPFKVPERVVVVPEIPRNGAGKVQRAAVAKLLLSSLEPLKG